MSLTARILLGFAALSLVGYLFVLRPILDRVERQYLEAAEEPLVDAAEILAGILGRGWERSGGAAIPEEFVKGVGAAHLRALDAQIYNLQKTRVATGLYVTDASGIVLFDSNDPGNVGRSFAHLLDVSRTLRGSYGARSTRSDEGDPASSVMFVAAPIFVHGRIAGVVSVSKPQRSMREFIAETRSRISSIAAAFAGVFLVAGFVLSRWVTEPLRRLTVHAVQVSLGRKPLPPRMPGRHLKILGQAVEQMREALENRRYVESYVRTLTHEMKGPVAGIAGAAELLAEEPPPERRARFAANIACEAKRLQDLIDRLLALASIESRSSLHSPARLRLDEIAARCAEAALPRAEAAGVRLCFEAPAPAEVVGEEFLIETAIANLIQNAIDFSPPGGLVRIAVRLLPGSHARVEVEDEGPGIPDFAIGRVFDRFYSLPRPGTGRKSSGLGLCFAREAALLHGGDAAIENRPCTDGRTGTRASITIPLAGTGSA